jgi:hypothetical protein
VAELLGVEPMTITRYRRWAVQDGLLKEVKPYVFRGKGGAGKAAEYEFDLTRVPGLVKLAFGMK